MQVMEAVVHYRRKSEPRTVMTGSKDIFAWAKTQGLTQAAAEEIWLLCFDTQQVLVGAFLINRGKVDGCQIALRQMLQPAFLTNAHTVAVVHNHPSGQVEPSIADIRFANDTNWIFDQLGFKVVDHVIVGGNSHKSFVAQTTVAKPERRA